MLVKFTSGAYQSAPSCLGPNGPQRYANAYIKVMQENFRSTSYGEEYVTSCFTNKAQTEKGIFTIGVNPIKEM